MAFLSRRLLQAFIAKISADAKALIFSMLNSDKESSRNTSQKADGQTLSSAGADAGSSRESLDRDSNEQSPLFCSDIQKQEKEDPKASITTDDIKEGKFNKYLTGSSFESKLSSNTTDNLPEGQQNLYYSDERVDNRLAELVSSSNGLQVSYSESEEVLEINLPSGRAANTLRNNGAAWIASSILYNNGAKVGINTCGEGSAIFGIIGRSSTGATQTLSVSNASRQGLLNIYDDGLVTLGYNCHTGTDTKFMIRNSSKCTFSNAMEIHQSRAGSGNALSITNNGRHDGVNTGLSINVSRGASNYALKIENGDHWQSSGNMGIGMVPCTNVRAGVSGTGNTGSTSSIAAWNSEGTQVFNVHDNGDVFASQLRTADIENTPAPLWKLGAVKEGSSVHETSCYVEVEINNTIYKLALVK